MTKAGEWGEKIPVGVIYKNDRKKYEDNFPFIVGEKGLVGAAFNAEKFASLVEGYR